MKQQQQSRQRLYIIVQMEKNDDSSWKGCLHDDLTIILKNMKSKTQLLLSISILIDTLVNKKWEGEEDRRNKIEQAKRQKQEAEKEIRVISNAEQLLIQRYEQAYTQQEEIKKLIERGLSRVLTIINGMPKQTGITEEEKQRIKGQINSVYHQKTLLYVNKLIEKIIMIFRCRLNAQVKKLTKIIELLQQGKKDIFFNDFIIESQVSNNKSKTKIDFHKQMSIKKQQRQKMKSKQKIIKDKFKNINFIYNILDVYKNSNTDPSVTIQQKKDKLYEELTIKNKFNSEQIESFISKCHYFTQKHFQQEEPEQIKHKNVPYSKSQIVKNYQNGKHTGSKRKSSITQITQNIQEIKGKNFQIKPSTRKQKASFNSQFPKATISKINFSLQTLQTAMKKHQISKPYGENIKIAQTKNKLPDIYKGLSCQNNQNINRRSEKYKINLKQTFNYSEMANSKNETEEQRLRSFRQKIQLKNVQVGTDPSIRQEILKLNNLKKDKRKTDTSIDQAIYIRRTINRFFQNRFNVFY